MLPFAISFSDELCARALRVSEHNDLAHAVDLLGLRSSRPALVLVGGAKGLETHHEIIVLEVLHAVAQAAESLDAVILDGGSQSGLIALMGRTYAEGKFRFPLAGVVVERMVRWPGKDNPEARANLESHHTHFMIIPGSRWGDESEWLAISAGAIARTRASLTILINGGEISRQDVNLSLQANRPVVVISGTGRLADELAESLSSPLIHVISATDSAALSSKLYTLLTRS